VQTLVLTGVVVPVAVYGAVPLLLRLLTGPIPGAAARHAPPCKSPGGERMNDLIEATAFISPAPGREDELRESLRAVVARTVEEPGCLEFRVFELEDRPGHFVLWERFVDQAALEVHMAAEWTREYFASGVAGRTDVHRVRALAPASPASGA
jgi:quinol monooxygenase YgiN